MILHAKIYWPEAITTMLYPYSLKEFSEQLNELKVGDDGITPMEHFAGTTIYITPKIITYVAVQFMYRVKYFKATYLD